MATEGKGEAEYVALEDDGSKAAKKFYERVRTPLLTDLSIDWNGMPVADVYPGKLTDLFSAKPVILHGRYTAGASGVIRLRGKLAGQPYVREIAVNLPESNDANPALATLWARTRIDELSTDAAEPAERKGRCRARRSDNEYRPGIRPDDEIHIIRRRRGQACQPQRLTDDRLGSERAAGRDGSGECDGSVPKGLRKMGK